MRKALPVPAKLWMNGGNPEIGTRRKPSETDEKKIRTEEVEVSGRRCESKHGERDPF
jgi:hypothetical protein